MVHGELGRYSLSIASHVHCIKYWFRLLHVEQSRLPNQAYRMLVNLDESGGGGGGIKKMDNGDTRTPGKTGFYFVYLQQGVGDVKSFMYVFMQKTVRHVPT